MTSRIIDYGSLSESQNDVTHHVSVKFHIVSKKKKKKKNAHVFIYSSQNSTCTLNYYPHMLDKKLSTFHRKRFCLRNSIEYLQQSTLIKK